MKITDDLGHKPTLKEIHAKRKPFDILTVHIDPYIRMEFEKEIHAVLTSKMVNDLLHGLAKGDYMIVERTSK